MHASLAMHAPRSGKKQTNLAMHAPWLCKMQAILVMHTPAHTHAHGSAPAGSHDRSLRRWQRSSEPFFVEEEKEARLESMFEADLEAGGGQQGAEAALAGPLGRVAVGEGEEGGAAPAGVWGCGGGWLRCTRCTRGSGCACVP